MLAHNVYFTLTDNSGTARQALVDSCRKYLTKHPGIVSVAVGTIEPTLTRLVNDQGFDVSLHILFDSVAAHDAYQDAPRHHEFVEKNKGNWKQVRVFDSNVEPS